MTDYLKLEKSITWDFTVARGGLVARYGHQKDTYWKQAQSELDPLPIYHKPKRISKTLYDLARKQLKGGYGPTS